MRNERFWWPLELSRYERRVVERTADSLKHHAPRHDRKRAAVAAELLARTMNSHVGRIIDCDTLPSHCHLLNGWGNAPLPRGQLLDGYAGYIHRDSGGELYVQQRSDEGDFHPWQSFAYALMAGVEPGAEVGDTGCSLLQLARNSRYLNTRDGCELGHLLYACAQFGLGSATRFSLGGESVDLAQLVQLAVEAHHHGHFKVCRKTHLSEGLCAIAAFDPELAHYRVAAQGFLSGQLDILEVLAAALVGVRDASDRERRLPANSVVHALRNSLAIEGFVENHYYLAGHLIELACLAHGAGYSVTRRQWNAAHFVVDELNALLPTYLPRVWFPGCFLHFGHYRRAITLLEEHASGARLDRQSLARFTADFSTPAPALEAAGGAEAGQDDGVFITSPRRSVPARVEFAAALSAYRDVAAPGLELRGDFGHFRRVLIGGWPRSIHFELLDYGAGALVDSAGSGIGVELHVERRDPSVIASLARVQEQLERGSDLTSEFDDNWAHGSGGRLRVVLADGAPPQMVASCLSRLIASALPVLGPLLRS